MQQVKELLVDQLKDLLDAETRLTQALPKLAEAAHHPKLKEAFEKHLLQTRGQVDRLKIAFELLGEAAESKPCKAMAGLIKEGEESIQESREKDPIAADLALIATAQRVEHYEISAYGTARTLARQIGQIDCARLLTQTLGEEESADFLLTMIAEPLLQQATLDDMGADTDLELVGAGTSPRNSSSKKSSRKS